MTSPSPLFSLSPVNSFYNFPNSHVVYHHLIITLDVIKMILFIIMITMVIIITLIQKLLFKTSFRELTATKITVYQLSCINNKRSTFKGKLLPNNEWPMSELGPATQRPICLISAGQFCPRWCRDGQCNIKALSPASTLAWWEKAIWTRLKTTFSAGGVIDHLPPHSMGAHWNSV